MCCEEHKHSLAKAALSMDDLDHWSSSFLEQAAADASFGARKDVEKKCDIRKDPNRLKKILAKLPSASSITLPEALQSKLVRATFYLLKIILDEAKHFITCCCYCVVDLNDRRLFLT